MPTLLAAAGESDIKDKLLEGHRIGDRTYKVHLDGFDQTDYLSGKTEESARRGFLYFSDDGDLLAVRGKRVKAHFMIQEATGIDVWRNPFKTLRAPILFDLQIDPGERAQEGMNYNDWWYRRAYALIPIQEQVAKALATFKEFPPRQKPASFTISDALDALSSPGGPGK
jgi:arylsulfatase A-like enzyme